MSHPATPFNTATATTADLLRLGYLNGAVGMLIFSGSLPATRIAVLAFDPVFLTVARAVIAALCAIAWMAVGGARWPERGDLGRLAVVALGVVVGFPLLTALALERTTAVHAMIFIGLLPLATAVFGVLRGRERPSFAFWAFSLAGCALVVGYALAGGGAVAVTAADLYLLAAILACGLGYAEGAVLARRLGGFQVIAWALVLALPAMAVLMALTWPDTLSGIATSAWLGLGYVSLFSMFVGFLFWYRGLALGGIAAVGQIQLLQPFCGIALAALVLAEPVGWPVVAVAAGVALCVWLARRSARRPGGTRP
jgi:drug/metabolite transporter (DMT)-like permease